MNLYDNLMMATRQLEHVVENICKCDIHSFVLLRPCNKCSLGARLKEFYYK
jgi:hypothetical protein